MNHPPHLRQRLTAVATAGATLAVTLTLLVGMPYILWRATGLPWPEHVSSLSEFGQRLTQPVSDPLMIELLAMVGWMCWATFAYTVARETLWYTTHLPQLLRDRHAHHEHLATLSVKGSLAALCIGTLVIALISLWRPHTVNAQEPSFLAAARAHTTATAPLIPTSIRQATAQPVAVATPAQTTTVSPSPARSQPPEETETVRHLEYTLVEGDTLWNIAHTHLGDALKWPRIYALNKDRLQRDGARLTDPDLIRPGWQLTIPISRAATPPPAPPPTPAHPTPDKPPTKPAQTAPPQPTPSQHKDAGQQDGGEHTHSRAGRHNEATTHKADTQTAPAAISLGAASLIGITAAAGLFAARRYWYFYQHRRREPGRDTVVPALSPLVDKAAQAAHAATGPPSPHDADTLITRRTAPQQPRAAGTVTIGVRDNTEVPLDALAMPGGCTWLGPGSQDAARALLVGILTAAERRRPEPPSITAVVTEDVAERLLPGLPTPFTALTHSADTAQAIHAAEQHLISHARTQDEKDTAPDAIEPTGTANAAHETNPGTLLLLAEPDAAHTGQLQALATRNHPSTLIVLTLNHPLPGAQSWHVADDGTTTHPDTHDQHPGALRLFHLTPEAGRDVTDVLLTAHGQRPRQRIRSTPTAPPDDGDHPDTPATSTAHSTPSRPPVVDTSWPAQTKPVRLHVLGPITLYARGHPEPIGTHLRSEVHEFLALLAAHPTGLLASDIADKLHLAPGNDHNALKNLRRAVRRALRAATGITEQEFILLHGELHKLHPELVETDLAEFDSTLKRAFSTSDTKAATPSEMLAAVREALAHYRGPFAQGSDYLWVDAIREHLTMKATDAALRLARQAEHTTNTSPDEYGAVLTLLEHLSALHPDHERLAQHTIRGYQATGRHDAARHTYLRLKRHLAELGLEPELATDALLTPRTHSRQTR